MAVVELATLIARVQDDIKTNASNQTTSQKIQDAVVDTIDSLESWATAYVLTKPFSSRSYTLRATGNVTTDSNAFAAAVDALDDDDTLYIDGLLALSLSESSPGNGWWSILKRINLIGLGKESGFDLREDTVLGFPNYSATINRSTDQALVGTITATAEAFVVVTSGFGENIAVGDYLFVWAENALTGCIPDGYDAGSNPNAKQCPGELVQCIYKETSGANTVVYVDHPFMENFTTSPRVNIRTAARDYAGIVIENLRFTCTDPGNRADGLYSALNIMDTPHLRIHGCTFDGEGGHCAINSPDFVARDLYFDLDKPTTYGLGIGVMCARFDAQLKGITRSPTGAYHVFTTGSGPTFVDSGTHSVGYSWGRVRLDANSCGTGAWDTHSSCRDVTLYDSTLNGKLTAPAGGGNAGVIVRGRYTKFDNVRLLMPTWGSAVEVRATGFEWNGGGVTGGFHGVLPIGTSNSVLRNLTFNAQEVNAIRIEAALGATANTHVEVRNCRFTGCGSRTTGSENSLIWADTSGQILVEGCDMRFANQHVNCRGTIEIGSQAASKVDVRPNNDFTGWTASGTRTAYGVIGTNRVAVQTAAELAYSLPVLRANARQMAHVDMIDGANGNYFLMISPPVVTTISEFAVVLDSVPSGGTLSVDLQYFWFEEAESIINASLLSAPITFDSDDNDGEAKYGSLVALPILDAGSKVVVVVTGDALNQAGATASLGFYTG